MPTSTGKIYLGSTLVASGETAGWQRPADWLAVTDMSATVGVAGIYAVSNTDSNFVAFTISGAYTVDWGDGTSASYSSGATAERNYVYGDLSSGTLSTRGYRQAIITITPQSGQSLTSINFNVKHSTAGLVSGASTGWLDVEVNAPSATSLNLFNGSNVFHRRLEQATIHAWGGTNLQQMFMFLPSLQSVPLFDTGSATSFFETFRGCSSLRGVPLFDTSSGTGFAGMFSGCTSLLSVPLFDTSSGADFTSMFNGCTSLQSVPLFDTGSATSFNSIFNSCASLQSVPLFDTSGVTNFNAAFNTCRPLAAIPALDMSAATNVTNTFGTATSLAKVEATGIAINVSFANCSLSAAALDEIYTNLADLTGLSGQTITVTGNYGTAGDDTTIATNKNWTVTG